MNNKEFLGGLLAGLILVAFIGFIGWQLKPEVKPYEEPKIVIDGKAYPMSQVVQEIVRFIQKAPIESNQ